MLCSRQNVCNSPRSTHCQHFTVNAKAPRKKIITLTTVLWELLTHAMQQFCSVQHLSNFKCHDVYVALVTQPYVGTGDYSRSNEDRRHHGIVTNVEEYYDT